jgi:PIN domain nuclease of toxin-antitoxin system
MSPNKLSKKVIKEIQNKSNELWLSPISVWETIILIERNRIVLNIPINEWISKALTSTPIYEAPITNEIAIKSRFINLPHQDPADRFIAATALVNNLTLITADQNLALSKEISSILN